MAGLTSTSHHPFRLQLSKPIPILSYRFNLFTLRLRKSATWWPSVSFTTTGSASVVVSGYGGRGGWSSFSPEPDDVEIGFEEDDADDDAPDISTITSGTVRLIDQSHNMVGVVSKSEALRRADEAGLGLVVLSPDAEPPVVKIMNPSKYKYEKQKKQRDQQKKSTAGRTGVKELKMSYNIGSHDYAVRLKAARKFLKDGDKLKVIVNLKGRENVFRNVAIEVMKRFQSDLGELAIEEHQNFVEKNIYMVFTPNKVVLQKARESRKNGESTNNNEPTKNGESKNNNEPTKNDESTADEVPGGPFFALKDQQIV